MRSMLFVLSFLSLSACAAETAPAIDTTSWVGIIAAALATLWSVLLYPYLQKKISESQATAQAVQIDMSKSLVAQKGAILSQAITFAETHALSIANTQFPTLAAKVAAGKLKTSADVKAELYSWGDVLKADLITYFNTSNIDVIKVLGEKTIDGLIDAAAAKVSPFPGKEVAVELLEKNVAPLLVNYGVTWVQKYYNGSLPAHEVDTAKSTGLLPPETTTAA